MIQRYVNRFITKSLVNDQSLMLRGWEKSEEEIFLIENSPGGWSIDKDLSEVLLCLVREFKLSSIVEIGAGYSTLILNYAQSRFSPDCSKVYSIEENVDWFKVPEKLKSVLKDFSFNLLSSRLRFKFGYFGIYAKYLPLENIRLDQVDMVVVDGPPYYFGREGGLDELFDKLKPRSLIILDDAERYTEKCVIFKWLKVYHGLELVFYEESFGTKGLAILRVTKGLKRKFSVSAFILGFYQGMKRVLNYRNIRRKQLAVK
ncbi:class I SAM-dependent methyltransferase [Negadavirga shengliensis]|uniref:Class I SAM-dependent methyltransferase n=1 Tax=Negadavirga shengliensis TaxID=1389218 RepID=A0ABV9T4C0_9BACT